MTDYYDYIDEYVNGQLKGDALVSFEEAMADDKNLSDAVRNHHVAMDVIGSLIEDEVRGVIATETKEKGSSPTLNDDLSSKKGKIRWIKILQGAAAACIVLSIGYWGLNTINQESVVQFAKVYSEPAWPTERGDDTDTYSEIFTEYFNGNRNTAKRTLRSDRDEVSLTWLSEIYMSEQKFDSVLINLPKEKFDDKLKRDRINYLKILSLYYIEKTNEAKSEFHQLPKDTDIFYLNIYAKLFPSE